jgi:hypothetical protein
LPFTVGVGQDEDPVALVGGTHVRCLPAIPLRIEPERGQVPENVVDSPAKESESVLQEDVFGS